MSRFDDIAATWEDDPQKAVRAGEVADAIRRALPLSQGMRALEYGSGTGLLARALVDDLGHITLADASSGMTEVATRLIAGDDRLTAIRLDLSVDPLPTERFDLIVSLLALHHVHDIAALLTCFRDLLTPGGRIALADLDADEGGSFHAEHGDFDGHDGFDRDRLADLLERSGFAGVEFSTATVLTKEVGGESRDYPIFLAVGHRADPG